MMLTNIENGTFYKRADGTYTYNIICTDEKDRSVEVIIPKTMISIGYDISPHAKNGIKIINSINMSVYPLSYEENYELFTVSIKDDGDKNGTN